MSVYVVEVKGEEPTRVVLGCSAAHSFSAWLAFKGRANVVRMTDKAPERDEAERQRVNALCEEWFNETEGAR